MTDPRNHADTPRKFATAAISGARLEYEAVASSILAATATAPVDEIAEQAVLLLAHRRELMSLTGHYKHLAGRTPDVSKHEYRQIGEAAGDLVIRLRAFRRSLPKGWRRMEPL